MINLHQQQTAPIGQLHLADYNPREMLESEMEKLVNSLCEFGFVEPVVARKEDGLVIGGHQRLEAMRRILATGGMEPSAIDAYGVPVVFIEGVTDERAKLLNLALNKIHGDWDYTKLSSLFESLGNMGDTVELSGFTTVEIEDITTLMSTTLPALDNLADPDAGIAAAARSFSFKVETDDEAALCRDVLGRYGMTGPGNAAAALVAAMRVAGEHAVDSPPEPKATPTARRKRAVTP